MTIQSTPFVLCLLGFPGVGKLAIAQTLARLTGAQVVDNHWMNDPILRLVAHDSATPVPEAVWPLVSVGI
jgi:predicted kinase